MEYSVVTSVTQKKNWLPDRKIRSYEAQQILSLFYLFVTVFSLDRVQTTEYVLNCVGANSQVIQPWFVNVEQTIVSDGWGTFNRNSDAFVLAFETCNVHNLPVS